MSRFHTSRSRQRHGVQPLVAFLLVASFGILFAGCKGPEDPGVEDYSFTEGDLALREALLAQSGATVTSSDTPYLEPIDGGSGSTLETGPVLDLGAATAYQAIRADKAPAADGNVFRVINDFVNVRATPASDGAYLGRLERGGLVDVQSFADAAWAKVKVITTGQEGYVSTRYIAKLVSEEGLEAEKAKYKGKYFVNFGYVNVRTSPDSQSPKLGEIPGQTIITPVSTEGDWVRVMFEGKEGYVSLQYLSPFLPNMLVRQERYTLPVLVYDLREPGALEALGSHLSRLNQAGQRIIRLKDFVDILLAQEERDVRLPPKAVALVVGGVTAQNQADLSATLLGASARATLLIETKNIGLDGITEKMASTLLANGFDLASAGHTGDDLRSLTNAQLDLELRQSRTLLEELTGTTVYTIGYPLGGLNPRVMESAAKAGYLLGVGSNPSTTFTRQDLLKLPSYSVSPTMNADAVMKLIQP